MSSKSVKDYLNLPCTIEFVHDTSDAEHPVWFAAVRELRGCMTEANDFDEAARQIRDAMRVWIEDALEAGEAIGSYSP